eukprot:TRINITY_DN6260_c0_g1_i1.p1 TRINITY_DN6260_c0_g1~~TRINITY_DN6260_c0_g1_i1.p1  ORF type:complete len:95 (+),score=21.36 TRINITY_DN6260_c0_g1_i1:23-286(+)
MFPNIFQWIEFMDSDDEKEWEKFITFFAESKTGLVTLSNEVTKTLVDNEMKSSVIPSIVGKLKAPPLDPKYQRLKEKESKKETAGRI